MSMEPEPGGPAGVEGGAFHPDLENGRASGMVHLSPAGIRFESEKGNVRLPLEGLNIALGGANDRLIFFTHPLQPEATIHTADHSVLHHPVFADRSELIAQIGRVRTKKRTARAVLLSVICVLIGSVAGLVMAKDLLVKAVASGIPTEWEITLGDKLFETITASERIVQDEALEAQFAKLTGPLVAGIADKRYPLKFHIVEDPTLNAYALPGGNVVVHSGLMLAADTPEEVAGVLAHEIAHVTQRHGFRGIISSLGLYAILQAFIGDASSLLAAIANNSAFLIDRKFSRDFEREADATGWDYLLEADIEPRGMIEFFKKMEAEEKKLMSNVPDGAEGALSIVSTHPATRERMESLEAKWSESDRKSGHRKFELNYDDFKASLRARLHSAPDSERN